MRRAAKVDANQRVIVEALRKCGATVQSLASVGDGVPDLLVGYAGETWLLEVKDPSHPPSARRLTPLQKLWHERWRGKRAYVVETVAQAFDIVLRRP